LFASLALKTAPDLNVLSGRRLFLLTEGSGIWTVMMATVSQIIPHVNILLTFGMPCTRDPVLRYWTHLTLDDIFTLLLRATISTIHSVTPSIWLWDV
jgi:hypothetical protein